MAEKIVKDSQCLAKDLVNDCISRQAAIDYCYQLINVEHQQGSDEMNYGHERVNQTETILHHLENMPSAQPERKPGKWNITDAYPHNVYCSECYTRFAQTHWAVWEDGSLPRNFCPNCGADMREVSE